MAVSRVRVTKSTKAYWPRTCQVLEFTEGETVVGELAEHLATTIPADVEILDAEPTAEPDDEPDGDTVPDGTAQDVLSWVGDDKDRAAQALEAEHGRDKPRSTLIAALEKLAGQESQ